MGHFQNSISRKKYCYHHLEAAVQVEGGPGYGALIVADAALPAGGPFAVLRRQGAAPQALSSASLPHRCGFGKWNLYSSFNAW